MNIDHEQRTTDNGQLTENDVRVLLDKLSSLRKEIGKVIVGQREAVEELLTTFVAGGHCLLEGVPGPLSEEAGDAPARVCP